MVMLWSDRRVILVRGQGEPAPCMIAHPEALESALVTTVATSARTWGRADRRLNNVHKVPRISINYNDCEYPAN